MNFKIMTLFPEAIEPYTSSSILGRAQKEKLINVEYFNIRDYSKDKHKKVDDTPYGGGYGMVMTPQPLFDCHKEITKNLKGNSVTLYMSPAGKPFNHDLALSLKQYDNVIIVCGHYEGIDQRFIDKAVDFEVSVGDYVLTGGELACAIVIDAVSRLVDGVLPDKECYTKESIASGLLEYPQYTKPATYNGDEVPCVLLCGDHKKIEQWQRQMSLKKTLIARPDLIESASLSKDDILYIESITNKDIKR